MAKPSRQMLDDYRGHQLLMKAAMVLPCSSKESSHKLFFWQYQQNRSLQLTDMDIQVQELYWNCGLSAAVKDEVSVEVIYLERT